MIAHDLISGKPLFVAPWLHTSHPSQRSSPHVSLGDVPKTSVTSMGSVATAQLKIIDLTTN